MSNGLLRKPSSRIAKILEREALPLNHESTKNSLCLCEFVVKSQPSGYAILPEKCGRLKKGCLRQWARCLTWLRFEFESAAWTGLNTGDCFG